jgi:2-polyprenyl-3-methyl-5-hydroxy-6-metoxy-1,4-benzoquinol methylase
MRDMANGEYGEDIWEAKIKKQGAVGVIRGTNCSLDTVNRQTKERMELIDKEVLTKLKEKSKILDAGVGPMARFAIEFAKRNYQVTGVDISQTTLDHAKKHIEEEGVKIELIKDDIVSLSSITDKFDLIFCIETFFHVPPHLTGIALKRFWDILNPGGYCLVQFGITTKKSVTNRIYDFLYWGGHYLKRIFGAGFKVNISRFTKREITEMIEKSGFRIEKELEHGIFLIKKAK